MEDEPRGEGVGLEALLTDGAAGAGIFRAGAVTLVAVKAGEHRSPGAGMDSNSRGSLRGRNRNQGPLSLGPEAWSPVTALF